MAKKFDDLMHEAQHDWSEDAWRIYEAASAVFKAEMDGRARLGAQLVVARNEAVGRGHEQGPSADDRDLPTPSLRDLLAFADMADRLVARGKAAYDADETLRLAAEAALHKIGEAVARLPEDFLDAHPEVPWRSMKGMRNIVAHACEQVDYQIIWNALERRLPREVERVRALLGEQDRGGI